MAEGPGAVGAQVEVLVPPDCGRSGCGPAADGTGVRWGVAVGGPDDQEPIGDCPSLTEPLAAPLFGAADSDGIVDG